MWRCGGEKRGECWRPFFARSSGLGPWWSDDRRGWYPQPARGIDKDEKGSRKLVSEADTSRHYFVSILPLIFIVGDGSVCRRSHLNHRDSSPRRRKKASSAHSDCFRCRPIPPPRISLVVDQPASLVHSLLPFIRKKKGGIPRETNSIK